MINDRNIRRFLTNIFAFPAGYFADHSADELGISEEERQELIKLHKPTPLDERTTKQERLSEFERAIGAFDKQ